MSNFFAQFITSTVEQNNERAALFGRRDDTEDWVSLEKAEYLAGGLGPYELQMDIEDGTIYQVEDGEVKDTIAPATFKVINKKTEKSHTLFAFKLDGTEVTAFLNEAKNGASYIGLAWSKLRKPTTRSRAF